MLPWMTPTLARWSITSRNNQLATSRPLSSLTNRSSTPRLRASLQSTLSKETEQQNPDLPPHQVPRCSPQPQWMVTIILPCLYPYATPLPISGYLAPTFPYLLSLTGIIMGFRHSCQLPSRTEVILGLEQKFSATGAPRPLEEGAKLNWAERGHLSINPIPSSRLSPIITHNHGSLGPLASSLHLCMYMCIYVSTSVYMNVFAK